MAATTGYRSWRVQCDTQVSNFCFTFYKIWVKKEWGHEVLWSYLRTPTLRVRVQLFLVHEFSFTDIFNDTVILESSYIEENFFVLLPFFMAVATYCYYEKVRRTMRTEIVSYFLKQQTHVHRTASILKHCIPNIKFLECTLLTFTSLKQCNIILSLNSINIP